MKFKGKGHCLEYFKRKLEAYPMDEPFFDEDLLWLFKHHPRFAEKTRGLNVISFVKHKNPRNPRTYALYAVLEDGSEVDWSYRKVIDYIFSGEKMYKIMNIYQAFRRAIEDQIIIFKERRRLGSLYLTDDGEWLLGSEVEVHHDPSFKELVIQFLEQENLELWDVPLKEGKDGISYDIADPQLRERWREFHREKAELKLLSRETHRMMRSRGKCVTS